LVAEGEERVEENRVSAAGKEFVEGLAFAFAFDVGVLKEREKFSVAFEEFAKSEEFFLNAVHDAFGVGHLEEGAGVTGIDRVVRHGGQFF
jgi:hypothetical protein